MIRLNMIPLNDGCVFECSGHANFAPLGEDIVCAGVSALSMALILRWKDMERERLLTFRELSVDRGEIFAVVEYPQDSNLLPQVNETVKTALAGFEQIEHLYPEYFTIE